MTRSIGLYSSFRLPTALAERMYSTPSALKPKMFARKFSSDGREPMSGAMTRQKSDALAAQRADDIRTPTDRQTASGRCAPRGR